MSNQSSQQNKIKKEKLDIDFKKLCLSTSLTAEKLLQGTQNGGDLNSQNIYHSNFTALHFLCQKENVSAELLTILLDHGADVNIVSDSNFTALHLLCKNPNVTPELLTILLDHGADVNSISNSKSTALHLLCKNPNVTPELIQAVLGHNFKKINSRLYGKDGEAPIHVLCSNANVTPETLTILIDHGADVNMTTYDSYTPLHLLCICCNSPLELIKVLVSNGADVNCKSSHYLDNEIALHKICKKANVTSKILQFLIDSGSDINSIAKGNYTPLHYLCENYKVNCEMLAIMIKNGANVNSENIILNVKTPLECLCFNQGVSKEVLETLIKGGVKIKAENDRKVYPIFNICSNFNLNPEMLEMLLEIGCVVDSGPEKGRNGDSAILALCRNKKCTVKCLKLLIKNGADVNNNPSRIRNKPIYSLQAENQETPELLSILIENGASINLKDTSGNSLIHYICEKSNISAKSLKILEENGMDFTCKNDKMETALHVICKNKNISPEIIKMLIEKGVDPNSKDHIGHTAICYLVNYISVERDCCKYAYHLVKLGADTHFKFQISKTDVVGTFSDHEYVTTTAKYSSVAELIINKTIKAEILRQILQGDYQHALNTDFKNYLERQEFTDSTILGEKEFKIHKSIVQLRTGKSIKQIKQIIEQNKKTSEVEFSTEQIKAFFEWIYFDKKPDNFENDIKNQNDRSEMSSQVVNIFQELQLNKKVVFKKSLKQSLLELYEDDETKDYKIIVNNRPIGVHRMVLQARSGLFRGMFLGTNEGKNGQVNDYSGISYQSMKILIKYLYSGEINFNILTQEIKENLEYSIDYFQLGEMSALQLKYELMFN
ncbi:ankyrin repeat-containing protein [Anaeramoeba flamelloides]|uniref:Ankyrin repeat-containing protein n=1 Tax=Anaeramoeba flamelloides TaxID=1746091 RepID=A0ABQ8XA16_9EUKA|nr:ankyrin repeat-containing protein [Anaeramoeba flamelloides]